MIRILFISHYADLYGANRSLLALIAGLQSKGIQCYILIPRHGPFFDECKKRKLEIAIRSFEVAFVENVNRGLHRFVRRLKNLPRIINYILKVNPDIIYTNSSVIDVGIIASKLVGKKHIWHIREMADLHYQIYYDLGKAFLHFLINRSNKVICISNAVKHHLKLNSTKTEVIYNGVISEKEIKSVKKAKNVCTLGIVGYISEGKNQLEAIKAVQLYNKNHSPVSLHLYGHGDQKYIQLLERYLESEPDIRSIEFKGFDNAIENIYNKIDVLILCSEHEAMGRVTAEAMAFGVPVIGKKSGATAEIIEDGINGLLYSVDHLDLAEKIEKLISDPILYRSLSKNGIEKAKGHFTNEKYVANVHEVIKSLNNAIQ